MKNSRSSLQGAVDIVLAATLWSLGGLLIKLIPWSPLSINSARCLIALLLKLLISRRMSGVPTAATLAAGICFSITTTAITSATKWTSAANAILLQYTSPLFLILLLSFVQHRKPRRSELLCCFGILGGIFLCCSGQTSRGSAWGNAMALLSGAAFALMFFFSSRPSADPSAANAIGFFLGFCAGFPWLVRETDWSGHTVLLLIVLGAGQFCLAYALFERGIRKVSPVTANFLATLEPVMNPIWVAVFYGEPVPLSSLAGGALTLLSALFYSLYPLVRGQRS